MSYFYTEHFRDLLEKVVGRVITYLTAATEELEAATKELEIRTVLLARDLAENVEKAEKEQKRQEMLAEEREEREQV